MLVLAGQRQQECSTVGSQNRDRGFTGCFLLLKASGGMPWDRH